MSGRDVERVDYDRHPAPAPSSVSQATAVEQSRAVAEVQAAVVVAQERPRDTARAVAAMREACDQQALAERAYFRYSRAGSQISGPSIHFARELARCWGNLQYGIAELRRDDDKRESEMVAFAWDLETNTRSSNTFVVPHVRDTRQGRKDLTEVRDVYENNANMGARRVREAIFAVLPIWYTEDAQQRVNATMQRGTDGKPFARVVADLVEAYAERGISAAQLGDKLGRKRDAWTPHDVATLRVVWSSLQRGEVTLEDEFPQQRVTAAELAGGQTGQRAELRTAAPRTSPAADAAPRDTGEEGGGDAPRSDPPPAPASRPSAAERAAARGRRGEEAES